MQANEDRRRAMADRIIAACGGDIRGKRIAVLGIAFKPNTDDVREAPSMTIVPLLQRAGAQVAAYDPAAMGQAEKMLPGVEWCADPYATAKGADALIIVTEWNEFRALDFTRLAQLMAAPLLIDLRNIYRLPDMAQTGFRYISIGRPPVDPATSPKLRAAGGKI